MFKVGDRVVVRGWDDMLGEFGFDSDPEFIDVPYVGFAAAMKEFCGKVCTIRSIYDSYEKRFLIIELVDDSGNRVGSGFTMTMDMIEPAERLVEGCEPEELEEVLKSAWKT